MGEFWFYTSAVATGGLLGLLSVGVVLRRGKKRVTRNGPWQYNTRAGSAAAGPYSRAQMAILAPLALPMSEVIYYVATEDDEGSPLRCDQDYRVEGSPPDARWWSVTAYASDGFLIPNKADRWSFCSETVTPAADGRFSIRLSRTEKPGDWLPTGDGLSFVLALRVYNPGPTVRANPAVANLPAVTREGESHV
jgi:hypothetical protein